MDGWQSGTEHEWQEFSSGDKLAAWRRLADEACEPNPFLESWYLLPSLENFDPAGKCRLFTTSTDNQLTGLLPVEYCQQYSRYPIPHLANWRHPNMFCSVPLVSKGHEEEFWQGLLDWADANAKAALFLHLTDLPADGQLFAALQAVIARQDRAAAVVMDEERAMLKSDHSP